ncbi:iron ABC transporter substrate-binding protein [Solidesulfovibrio sp.]|uniref:iron ABC transporter substrate-binding protein n=1 Tax=Solidesulfovibrio sp. TaxID=2910990 RepID=UPI002B1F722E|nr:iron ABC transporter substrate-binding protein [Solidesulfovibrio sp.]MEA4857059.1 iron ABC transporter substrate-binding protein [Solidesulfovibrio sp.]
MPRRHPWSLAALLLMLLLPSGPAAAASRTVTDAAGRSVTVPATVSRIVCLGPGCLRLIAYLGATDKVVGIERFEIAQKTGRPYRLAHPELLALPVIGPGGPKSINQEPDLEAVLAVKPQVLFTSAMDGAVAQAMQDKLGIPVVVLSYGAFARYDPKVFDSLKLAGAILGLEARARAVADFLASAEADVRARAARAAAAPGFRKPTVYVGGTGLRGAHGLTSTDHPYAPLQWLGADNLASRVTDDGHAFLDREQLLALDPDILFVDAAGLSLVADEFSRQPEFVGALRAVREGRVHLLYPFTNYLTNLDTIVVDAYAAGKILYPEAFADIDPAAKADAVYAFLAGRPVYGQMAADFGPLGAVPGFVPHRPAAKGQ